MDPAAGCVVLYTVRDLPTLFKFVFWRGSPSAASEGGSSKLARLCRFVLGIIAPVNEEFRLVLFPVTAAALFHLFGFDLKASPYTW